MRQPAYLREVLTLSRYELGLLADLDDSELVLVALRGHCSLGRGVVAGLKDGNKRPPRLS